MTASVAAPMSPADAEREAVRQAALVAEILDASQAVVSDAETAATAAPRRAAGLAAYRANAAALAERALGAALPTVRALVGAQAFARLARDHWRAAPPERGDLAEWGAGCAAWLEALPELAAWPWLGDCARLDFALQHCERAADATFDAESLRLLESAPPERLRLRLRPGTAVLCSRWPIATLHAAHHGRDDPDLVPVRAALDAGRGECVLVARSGWRAIVHRLAPADAAFAAALLDGLTLARALDAAPAEFDFTAWLAQALRGSWLQGTATD